MKEQVIQLPDNLEVKEIKNGKIILIEKEKNNITYEDVAKRLFEDEFVYYVDECGMPSYGYSSEVENPNHCKSKKQAEKLLAINKLMNVAKYLNGDWQPKWNKGLCNYYICFDNFKNTIEVTYANTITFNVVYFKSRELAKQAIEILGEDIIRLAFCTDY